MSEATLCKFCDHVTVTERLDGTRDCEYCGAVEWHSSGRRQDEKNYPERDVDVWSLPEAPQVQVCGPPPAPEEVKQP